jgi:hypothetical protein
MVLFEEKEHIGLCTLLEDKKSQAGTLFDMREYSKLMLLFKKREHLKLILPLTRDLPKWVPTSSRELMFQHLSGEYKKLIISSKLLLHFGRILELNLTLRREH